MRFLPDFDAILLSHFDRSRIFTPEHRSLIFSNNGIIRSSVLVDGFVSALWKVQLTKGTATLVIRPLPFTGRKPITKRDEAAVEREARLLLQFHGARIVS